MLEDYNIVHLAIRRFQNSEICTIKKQGLEPLLVHLLSSPIPTFSCLTCTQQLMTKAGVRFGML